MHYVNPTLESGNYYSAVLHFGVNDLLQKTISKSDLVENLIENIRKTPVKCMSHEVSKVFVSAIVRNKRIPESLLEEVNEKISFMCKNNSNISNIHLFDDGLHLVELGRCILANNVIGCINNFLLKNRQHPNIHIHTME